MSGLTLTFEQVTWKFIGIIYLLGPTTAPSEGVKRYWADKHSWPRRVVWLWPMNMWPENQSGSSTHWGQPLYQVGIDQVKGSKDIKLTTQWVEKSGLTLTFKYLTWKSIGIIYLLWATPSLSLVLIKWTGQKILSGKHLVYRPTDRHTNRPLQNNIPPLSRGGNNKSN